MLISTIRTSADHVIGAIDRVKHVFRKPSVIKPLLEKRLFGSVGTSLQSQATWQTDTKFVSEKYFSIFWDEESAFFVVEGEEHSDHRFSQLWPPLAQYAEIA